MRVLTNKMGILAMITLGLAFCSESRAQLLVHDPPALYQNVLGYIAQGKQIVNEVTMIQNQLENLKSGNLTVEQVFLTGVGRWSNLLLQTGVISHDDARVVQQMQTLYAVSGLAGPNGKLNVAAVAQQTAAMLQQRRRAAQVAARNQAIREQAEAQKRALSASVAKAQAAAGAKQSAQAQSESLAAIGGTANLSLQQDATYYRLQTLAMQEQATKEEIAAQLYQAQMRDFGVVKSNRRLTAIPTFQ